jgi:ribosome-binding factor A
MSIRTDKVASEIKKAISMPLYGFASENGGGMITVTNVRVSADLSVATIHVSVYGNANEKSKVIRLLADDQGRFKRAITQSVRMRVVPELRFHLDDSLDQMDKISQILKANPPFPASLEAPEERVSDSNEDNEDLYMSGVRG